MLRIAVLVSIAVLCGAINLRSQQFRRDNLAGHFDLAQPPPGDVESSLETSFVCVQQDQDIDIPKFHNRARGRSCKFTNLYRNKDGFMVLVVKGSPSHTKLAHSKRRVCVFPYARHEIMCPHVHVYETYEALESEVLAWKASMYHRYFPDLTLYFRWACPANPGHSLWDDLYPAFVSLNKFALENDTFLPYLETKLADCSWTLYPEKEAVKLNPQPGQLLNIRIADRSQIDLLDPVFGRLSSVWHSWTSVQTFTWREARFVRQFNHTHSIVEASCDHESVLVSNPQACKDHPSAHLDHPRAKLYLIVPSHWLKIKQVMTNLSMEQVIADFGAKKQNAEALIHYQLEHHIGGPYLLQFEKIVMGAGDANMILTPEVAIGGSRGPHWAMRKFRDRMLDTYNIARRPSPSLGRDTRVTFIANKRFGLNDSNEIRLSLSTLESQHHFSSRSKYLDYATVPNFKDQLQKIHDTDIYVSGPGTGMLNAPFLPDGAAVVNVGAWTAIKLGWNTTKSDVVPLFMEQQVVGGGTPYLHVLFRNFSESSRAFLERPSAPPGFYGDLSANLNSIDLVELVLKARQRMIHGKVSIEKELGNIEDNLSPEGVIFRKYCAADPDRCNQVLRARNFGPCKTFPELWYELMVDELGARYDICTLNHNLISTLRLKYGLHHFDGPQPVWIWEAGVV